MTLLQPNETNTKVRYIYVQLKMFHTCEKIGNLVLAHLLCSLEGSWPQDVSLRVYRSGGRLDANDSDR